MNELDALLIAAELSGKSIDEMLAAAQKAGHTNYTDNQERFLFLLSQNYIEGAFALGLPVTITLAGKDRLQQLQKADKLKAMQKHEKWSERFWCFVAGVASTVLAQLIISAIAG